MRCILVQVNFHDPYFPSYYHQYLAKKWQKFSRVRERWHWQSFFFAFASTAHLPPFTSAASADVIGVRFFCGYVR